MKTLVRSLVYSVLLRFGWRGARRMNGGWALPTATQRLAHLDQLCADHQQSLGRRLTILEIGSLLGCSTSVLARYGTVLCVDPWPWGMSAFLRRTRGLDIIPCRGLSTNVLPLLQTKAFDLAYIDGNHSWPTVDADLMACIRLVCQGGIICGDDLERQIGDDLTPDEARFHRSLDYIDGYHPGVTHAVYTLFGHVNVKDGFWWAPDPSTKQQQGEAR